MFVYRDITESTTNWYLKQWKIKIDNEFGLCLVCYVCSKSIEKLSTLK